MRDHVLHAGLCGRKLRCAHQPVGGDAPPLSELLSNNEGLRDVSSPVLRSTFLHLGMLLFQMLASATSAWSINIPSSDQLEVPTARLAVSSMSKKHPEILNWNCWAPTGTVLLTENRKGRKQSWF